MLQPGNELLCIVRLLSFVRCGDDHNGLIRREILCCWVETAYCRLKAIFKGFYLKVLRKTLTYPSIAPREEWLVRYERPAKSFVSRQPQMEYLSGSQSLETFQVDAEHSFWTAKGLIVNVGFDSSLYVGSTSSIWTRWRINATFMIISCSANVRPMHARIPLPKGFHD